MTISMILPILFSTVAMAGNTKLDKNSVELANVLVQPEVRECIESAIKSHKLYMDMLSVSEVEIYQTSEPLLPGLADRQINHYIIQARSAADTGNNMIEPITVKFHIEVDSGTGVLSYRCSSNIQ